MKNTQKLIKCQNISLISLDFLTKLDILGSKKLNFILRVEEIISMYSHRCDSGIHFRLRIVREIISMHSRNCCSVMIRGGAKRIVSP